jgi:hypothetical protein
MKFCSTWVKLMDIKRASGWRVSLLAMFGALKELVQYYRGCPPPKSMKSIQ